MAGMERHRLPSEAACTSIMRNALVKFYNVQGEHIYTLETPAQVSSIEIRIGDSYFPESTKSCIANGCLMSTGSLPETHHHHLLGSQRLSSVPGLRTGSVCGARGTQGGQPPASVPAGHRQRPARGEGRGETQHAFTALLLCHQCIHTHHQGEKTASNCCVATAAAFHCFLLRVQQDCSPFPVFVLAPNP